MAASKRQGPGKARGASEDIDPSLTAAEERALRREIRDLDDPTRYLLVSATVPGLSLYYVLQDDVWDMDDPSHATLFKRRAAAKRIQEMLSPGVLVVPCQVDGRGKLVLSSIANRKAGRVRLAVRPTWRRKKKQARRTAR
jgi:hypothetical protein